MKINLLTLVFVLGSFSLFAQKTKTQAAAAPSIVLANGQVVKVTTTSEMDMEMGMGMSMKNNMTIYNTISVTNSTEDAYTVTNTLTRIIFDGSGMGQDIKLDSDKKEDMDTEMGQGFKEKIGKTTTATIDKRTGKINIISEGETKEVTDQEVNPMEAIMGGAENSSEENIKSVFFLLPQGKNIGYSWKDSVSQEKMKTVTTYTLKELTEGKAVVGYTSNTSGTNTMDAQGMSFDVTMNSVTNGEMVVDPKTFLVKTRTAKADVNGNIDMAGQTMDISSKANSTTVYQ